MPKLGDLLERKLPSDAYLLAKAVSELKFVSEAAGFKFYYIDGRQIHNEEEFYNIVSATLRLPEFFGRNTEALHDCLGDIDLAAPAIVEFDLYDYFALAAPDVFARVIAIFRRGYMRGAVPPVYFLFVGQPDLLPEKLEVIDPI